MREEMEQRADMEAANIARKGWGLYFWGSKSRGGVSRFWKSIEWLALL